MTEIKSPPTASETDVVANVARSAASRSGDIIICRNCSAPFTRGEWCFYDLCDPCFARFDDQKMRHRFGAIFGPPCDGTEDPDEWMKQQVGKTSEQGK